MRIVADEIYFNQSESCALIGVSLSTFRTLKADPDFPPCVVLLKRPMWRASDIKAWCKRRLNQTGKAA